MARRPLRGNTISIVLLYSLTLEVKNEPHRCCQLSLSITYTLPIHTFDIVMGDCFTIFVPRMGTQQPYESTHMVESCNSLFHARCNIICSSRIRCLDFDFTNNVVFVSSFGCSFNSVSKKNNQHTNNSLLFHDASLLSLLLLFLLLLLSLSCDT
jgi:hypothetical protein